MHKEREYFTCLGKYSLRTK